MTPDTILGMALLIFACFGFVMLGTYVAFTSYLDGLGWEEPR